MDEMTHKDATLLVLLEAEEHGEDSLHYKDGIYKRAVKRGYLDQQGRRGGATQWYSINAVLNRHPDLFRYEGEGCYGLTDKGRAEAERIRAGTETSGKRSRTRDGQPDFSWIPFYEEFADKLLAYRDDRSAILGQLRRIKQMPRVKMVSLDDQYPKGTKVPLEDVCPFTTFVAFNRMTSRENRTAIASVLGEFLGVEESAPVSFDGIPRALPLNSWLFAFKFNRREEDIDNLWRLFAIAFDYAENPDDPRIRRDFIEAYNAGREVKQAGPTNLTTGLYQMRPYDYLPLDDNCLSYIEANFSGIEDVRKRGDDGERYIALLEELKKEFEREGAPVTSFPQLSYEAWEGKNSSPEPEDLDPDPNPVPPPSYSLSDILENWFGEKDDLHRALGALRDKKNLILQGPPGTGKTWLAKRLAYAYMGEKVTERVLPVQFHPNMSYEDFVMGWRPTGADGGVNLKLADGPMMRMINRAKKDSDSDYFLVIEEINRGNPAQIFGEMLTLMEADKREESEALNLVHQQDGDERVYVPPNLYIIGTMNLADRSLAMVDYALRRRFAFLPMHPSVNEKWFAWMTRESGLSPDFLRKVQGAVNALNDFIKNDPNLGEDYQIGHSYVTAKDVENPSRWYRDVVHLNIEPLLHVYWDDDPESLAEARKALDIFGVNSSSDVAPAGDDEGEGDEEYEEEDE